MANYPTINRQCGDGRFNLSERTQAIKWIVIHYTGSGTAETQNAAKNNCLYFSTDNRGASADYFIDNSGIWQFNPNIHNFYTWHCGGGSILTASNGNSVGIEVVSSGADFTDVQKRHLRSLVLALMSEFNIDEKHIVRHYDANTVHKLCPAPYCGSAANDKKWAELRKFITTEEPKMNETSIWNHKVKSAKSGTQVAAGTRLAGIDGAANGTYNALKPGGSVRKQIDKIPAMEKDIAEIKALLKSIDKKLS